MSISAVSSGLNIGTRYAQQASVASVTNASDAQKLLGCEVMQLLAGAASVAANSGVSASSTTGMQINLTA